MKKCNELLSQNGTAPFRGARSKLVAGKVYVAELRSAIKLFERARGERGPQFNQQHGIRSVRQLPFLLLPA